MQVAHADRRDHAEQAQYMPPTMGCGMVNRALNLATAPSTR